MPEKLKQYKGRLSPASVAAGIRCACENARRLAGDADILLANGRNPSALALATLAIEESGKVSILRALALARTDEEAKADWKEYRSHTAKNRLWPIVEYAMKGARKLEDFRGLMSKDAEHPQILDQLKQLSFYTDFLGDKHWSIPTEVIDESLARSIVSVANILAKDSTVTQREIELWVQHVGPYWKMSMATMEKAVSDWYAAMQSEGLAPEGRNRMEQFIIDGINEN